MGTTCALSVADLFCFVIRDTLCCLTMIKQMVLGRSTRLHFFIDDLLNIDNPYLEKSKSDLSHRTLVETKLF